MPSYGQSVTLTYVAWDNTNNVGKTGDVANHTLRWVKDGTSGAPLNSPAEVDATNAPGLYKLVLTSAECQCQVGTLAGKSSTAAISIMPLTLAFENLPTAAPAASGGLPTVGTGSGQISPSAGNMTVAGYASGQDPATLTLATAANKLATDGSGRVLLQPSQTGVTIPAVTTVGSVTGSIGSIAGVTFPSNFGLLSIDSNGYVKLVGAPKKNAALNGFSFFMALSTDHYTAATGKSITATRSVNGGAFAACANAATEIGGGWYGINLTAADLNGDVISFSFAASGCDTALVTMITTP